MSGLFLPAVALHLNAFPGVVALSGPATELSPLGSRIKQDRSGFQEQQRQRVAQEARAERRQKKQVTGVFQYPRLQMGRWCRHGSAYQISLRCKQERELALRRIAEDRRSLQEKSQPGGQAFSPPAATPGQGHRLGGRVQTSVDNQCLLMVRPGVGL